ncbi:MAG: DUF4192 domain-containing protein [Propioniciclava sp.]
MTSAPGTTLTARTLTDLVELIPSLLGFRPAACVVAIVVVDGHVSVTARVDLPAHRPHRLAPQLAPIWRRFPHAQYVVVVCAEASADAWAAVAELHTTLPQRDRTLLFADGARWYDGPEDGGTAYGGNSPLAAAAVVAGHPVLASREALAAQLAPTRTAEEIGGALDRLRATPADRSSLVAEALRLVARADSGETSLDLDQATALCLASHDAAFLDAALFSTTDTNAGARRDLWAEVVRQSIPGCTGYALAALALAAWVCGQGALQVICLGKMVGQPGPERWFDTLSGINAEAVPPSEWPALRAALFRSGPECPRTGGNGGGLS